MPSLPRTRPAISIATATVGTALTPWGLSFIQSFAADKRLTDKEKRFEGNGVIAGVCLIGFFAVIACASTLHSQDVAVNDAADAAEAPKPHAGDLAGKMFGVGLIGAALLAASILPLSTALSVTESVVREAALDDRVREAPLFYVTYGVIGTTGAGLIFIPRTPLVAVLVLSQVLNAARQRPQLGFMNLLARNPELMGRHAATRPAAGGYLVTIALIGACVMSLGVLSVA